MANQKRREYKRETRYAERMTLPIETATVNKLSAAAAKLDVSLSEAARLSITAGLPKVQRMARRSNDQTAAQKRAER